VEVTFALAMLLDGDARCTEESKGKPKRVSRPFALALSLKPDIDRGASRVGGDAACQHPWNLYAKETGDVMVEWR